MSCECTELDDALATARALAATLDRYVTRTPSCASIHLRLARAHALGTCDDLERALDEHRRDGHCHRL